MTINSTRGPPPGDFTFLQRLKLKANKIGRVGGRRKREGIWGYMYAYG